MGMINQKRLVQMLRRWRKAAAAGRRRISMPKVDLKEEHQGTCKGHFIVYTMDQKRFMIPLKYLDSDVFRELFRMSEEEFGLPCNGPIILPCDAVFMDYILTLVRLGGRLSQELEKALCMCVVATGKCCATASSFPLVDQQGCSLLVH